LYAERDHLYAEFELYKTECIAAGKSLMDWSPKLKMGDLKPLITGLVQTAMIHLAGADMKASIVKAFKNDGCMDEDWLTSRMLLKSYKDALIWLWLVGRKRIHTRSLCPEM